MIEITDKRCTKGTVRFVLLVLVHSMANYIFCEWSKKSWTQNRQQNPRGQMNQSNEHAEENIARGEKENQTQRWEWIRRKLMETMAM